MHYYREPRSARNQTPGGLRIQKKNANRVFRTRSRAVSLAYFSSTNQQPHIYAFNERLLSRASTIIIDERNFHGPNVFIVNTNVRTCSMIRATNICCLEKGTHIRMGRKTTFPCTKVDTYNVYPEYYQGNHKIVLFVNNTFR